MVCISHQTLSSDQVEKSEIGGACNTYGGEERRIQRFGGGNLKVRGNLEDPGVDGRIILRWIFRKWDGSVDWNELAQDRDRWRALVNAVMNFQVPKYARNL